MDEISNDDTIGDGKKYLRRNFREGVPCPSTDGLYFLTCN